MHQCQFGAPTPKPTRFLVNFKVDDLRCFIALPTFDPRGFYVGPLPKECGHHHAHKLIGKTAARWNTAPSASYLPKLCEFLANLILHATASFGGGPESETCRTVQPSSKRRRTTESVVLWSQVLDSSNSRGRARMTIQSMQPQQFQGKASDSQQLQQRERLQQRAPE